MLLDDIKQVFDEAKANGFDVKTMKQVIKLRKLDKKGWITILAKVKNN